MAFVTYWDLCISKVILGGTLTSQADGATSTNALGNVHERMADNICDSDALQLAPTITRDIVHPIVALNGRSFSSLRRLCRFEFDLSAPEDLTAYSTALPLLAGIGMKIPVQWAHEKLQIPMADDSDEVLKPAPQPEAPAFLSAVPRGYTALAAAPQCLRRTRKKRLLLCRALYPVMSGRQSLTLFLCLSSRPCNLAAWKRLSSALLSFTLNWMMSSLLTCCHVRCGLLKHGGA